MATISAGERVLVRRITPDELAERAPEWDALVAASRRPNPLQLAGAVLAWHEAAPPATELVLVCAERGGRAAAGLALAIARRGPIRRLEVVGLPESVPCDVSAAPADIDLAATLVEEIRSLDFDYAELAALDADGALASAAGLARIPRLAGPVIDLSDAADPFGSLLSGNDRRSLGRRLRRLAEGGDLRIETTDRPPLDELLALHERRWERGGDSSFCTARGRLLHARLAERLAGTGVLRSTTVRLDGRLIGFQYAFLVGETLVCLRIAHDRELAQFSPGTVALKYAIEDGAAHGARRVELLGHDEDYKRRLATSFEPMSWGIGWARSVRGALASRAAQTALRLRLAARDRRA